MKRLALLAVLMALALPAAAADALLVAAVSTSTSSAQSTAFDCGIQVAVRCTGADASYRVCDTSVNSTCTAVTTDLVLAQNTTYDLGIPERQASAAQCRFAFITATGAGSCAMYKVTPRTIPQTP